MKTVDLETLDSSPGRHAQEQSWVARGEKGGGRMCSLGRRAGCVGGGAVALEEAVPCCAGLSRGCRTFSTADPSPAAP